MDMGFCYIFSNTSKKEKAVKEQMTVLQNMTIYGGLTALLEDKEQVPYAYILKKWDKQTESSPPT